MFCEIPDFGRCCLCLPLRKGILVFGYFNVLFSALMIGLYSYLVHIDINRSYLMFHGSVSSVDDEACLVIHLVDFVFAVILIYGGHTQKILYLKIFYYYAMTTLVATMMLQITGLITTDYMISWMFETCGLFLTGFCKNRSVPYAITYSSWEQTRQHDFDQHTNPIHFSSTRMALNIGLHIYLILLVRSLLKKLERSGNTYENQLHQFVNGEIKTDTNAVYPSIVIPNETV